MANPFIFIFYLLLLLLLLQTHSLQPPPPEPLLTFKATYDPSNTLLPNWNTTTPFCSWFGITCLQNQPYKLVLQNLSLSGPFPSSLLSLPHLRVLSLKHNLLTGPLPSFNLSSLSSLKLLFLSHNHFSGPFPPSLSSLSLLYRLDLSFNNFSGPLPLPSLNRLTHLLTLRLESNRLSGPISGLTLTSLQDLNLSNNHLSGPIPVSLSSFDVTSFADNPALCGPPLPPCKDSSPGPARPGELSPPPPSTTGVVVSSSPSSVPDKTFPKPGNGNGNGNGSKARMSLWAIIGIVIGDVAVLVIISLLLYCYIWRKKSGDSSSNNNNGNAAGLKAEKVVYSMSPHRNGGGGNGFERPQGRMVFFEGERQFELEDLLRASAEMLGKGVFGTAYKAVLDDGTVVAVKRLKEVQVVEKKEFEQQMEILGRIRHGNLVGLKAYYFARDEKLLVFDYLPNGSLFWLLHGNRGPGRTPLDWTTRLKIAAGAARGVAFIHNSCRALKLIHGNIKSTNVLIDKAGSACVSDFGLSSFAPTSSTNPRSNGYRAPESMDGRRLTQKADVYSFGVLLLEILTGKYPSVVDGSGPYGAVGVGGVVDLPRWVQSVVREEWTAEVFDLELMRYKDIEEEMVGLLQIAMACTAPAPDQRPRMGQVVRMIEEIRGVEVSPSHDAVDSDSTSISEDTGGVSQ